VKETGNQASSWTFIGIALGETVPEDDDVRQASSERYFHAIEQLRAQRLAYRVLNLWDGDPHGPNQARMCEPLATLYINDAWARKSKDPFLQGEVNLTLWRTDARDKHSDFTEDRGLCPSRTLADTATSSATELRMA
jgi:hypothetical protein